MLQAVPQLDTLVVPIGGGGLISGIAVAAKAIKPDLRIVGVQAELYPSMYNVIKGEHLPMRGDTLAEGIAVKSPSRITTEIIRHLVDDIVLVTEDQIDALVVHRHLGPRRTGSGALDPHHGGDGHPRACPSSPSRRRARPSQLPSLHQLRQFLK